MLISPLLSEHIVHTIEALLRSEKQDDEIIDLLKPFPIEEKIHILRFLSLKPEYVEDPASSEYSEEYYRYSERIYRIWRSIIPHDHVLHSHESCRALCEINKWWDTFGVTEGMTIQNYDELEQLLDTLSSTVEGKEYFKWVALYPTGEGEQDIWDDERRGAIICLGRCPYDKETEQFLARHLDDWINIQREVVQILFSVRSRLLAKLAPWYIKNDDFIKPILEEYL